MTLRVLHVGLGPVGAAIARQVASRKGMRSVAAADADDQKVGRDLASVIGLPRPLRIEITSDIRRAIRSAKPDIAVLCTGSSLRQVAPLIEQILACRVPIVSTAEELSYPTGANRRLARRIDLAARKAKVAVLGTGVNPGFVMDALPIALSAVCERVDSVSVVRVQDARVRRLPFQQKIGAGLTEDQFRKQVAQGAVRHVGLAESIQTIADALHWRLERVTDEIRPWIARVPVESELVAVDPGNVCGIVQDGVGYVSGVARISLHMEAYLGAPEPFDAITIEGSPRLHSRIDGGVHGDIATASIVVNSIAKVIAAPPGLRTMRDMPLPSFWAAS